MTVLANRLVFIVAICVGWAKAIHVAPTKHQSNLEPVVADSHAQVVALRAKLQKIAAGLAVTLDPKGSIAKSQTAASLHAFNDALLHTLKETETMKDSKMALKKLIDAQAGVKSLVKDMTIRQMELMKEGDDSQQSLLLGVLMSRQSQPMEKQMEVLKSKDFANLPVVQAILSRKDSKTPLFKQVAMYLDAHRPSKNVSAITPLGETLKLGKNGKPDVSPIVVALEGRIRRIEESEKKHESHHATEIKTLDDAAQKAMAKNNTKLAHRIERLKKREQHQYDKEAAMTRLDHQSLTDALDAIKKGDVKKLAKAKLALEKAMKAMKAHSNGFIVFIQEAHRAESLDCPFCVAQCIEKCSSGGNSYTTCLTNCADAGE